MKIYLSGDDFDLHGLLEILFIVDAHRSSWVDFLVVQVHDIFVEQFAARFHQLSTHAIQ